MHCAISTWRGFCSLPSDSEAASVSKHCVFSLSTLEIMCDSATAWFALIEKEHAKAWRWAVLSDEGLILREGQQPTQADAKRVAEEMLVLVHA
jgi:hypothetical protein